jgi:peptide/nickel transport system substrate-binding protein/oligopeptide transport system substrate-binding protein
MRFLSTSALRLALKLSMLAGALLAAPALLSAQETEPQEIEPRELVAAYAPKKLTLDPVHIYTTMESELATALYEGLASYHPLTLQPVPGVAADWEVSRDRTVYRFRLREEALYSNGDPVRAQDFRDSWMRAIDPATQAEYSFLFDVIKGARAYRNGQKAEVGIRVISDRILEVELEKPAGHFLKLLCHMAFAPVHPGYFGKEGWDAGERLIGNGPFFLAGRGPQELHLEKNRLYWDAKNVELDAVRIRLMGDPAEVSREFNAGRVHWATDWDSEALADRSKIVFHPLFATSYFYFVCAQKPWSDPRVRRALALLLPWPEIRTEDTLFPTTRLIPAIPGYPELEGIGAADEAQALKLLAEAGHPEGAGLPSISIKVPEGEESQRIAAIMARTWKQKLGMQVAVAPFAYDDYLLEVKKLDYTLGTVTWIGDYPDPLTFLQMWIAGSNLNDARFVDQDFDRLIDESLGEEDPQRYQILGKAESLLLSGAVVLPISHAPAFALIDLDWVEGWFPNVLNIHPFKYLRVRTERVPPGVALGGATAAPF